MRLLLVSTNLSACNPCCSVNVKSAVVVLSVTALIVFVVSNDSSNLFVVSLVILFLRSLVTTSPIGNLFAYDVASGGLSSTLSRSYSG